MKFLKVLSFSKYIGLTKSYKAKVTETRMVPVSTFSLFFFENVFINTYNISLTHFISNTITENINQNRDICNLN